MSPRRQARSGGSTRSIHPEAARRSPMAAPCRLAGDRRMRFPLAHRSAPWRVLQRVASGRVRHGLRRAARAGRPRARRYALKLARHPDSPWFSREAEILSRLRHPGVPRLMATGTWRPGAMGYPFLVMEHVDGESLYAWSLARNPSARDVGGLLAQASEVLAFAHQRGVLHRDFKGDNIRINPEDDSSSWTGARAGIRRPHRLPRPASFLLARRTT